MSRWPFALVLLLVAGPATAHWTPHPELPDWAQRGRLQWCLHYARADRQLVDLVLDGGQTLLHGGSFDSPETAAYAQQRGLRAMPYVCSRTFTTAELARANQLADAMVLRADGSQYLAYNNPARRYGSLGSDVWPAYVRDRTDRVMSLPDTAAVFFDNVWVGGDYQPANLAAWRTWAARQGLTVGDAPPDPGAGTQATAARAFLADQLVAYYASLREHCRRHDPPLLIAPNLGSLPGYGMRIIEAYGADLVFYETMSHPPFESNALRYKLGLAASHGRPTGILAYLPERIASLRGQRTWHEGMHHDFYPASPHAEEFALAAAEAAANGGTYIPCYNLFPSLPITDQTDPFCRRIHRAIKQSYTFLNTHAALYAAARPGASLALLYSAATTLQDRRAQGLEALSETLTAAGLPWEVVVPADLAGGLTGIDTLVVPNVGSANEPVAEGVVAFAEGGGRVILSGSFAVADELGRPADYAAARRLREALRLQDLPLRQWHREDLEPETATNLKVTRNPGRATRTFAGPAGRYRAWLAATDESDGTSTWTFAVGSRVVHTGRFDREDNQVHWFVTPDFALAPGDLLTLTVAADAGELGRVESLLLLGAAGGLGARLGRGEVVYAPAGLAGESPAALRDLLRPTVDLPRPQKLAVSLLDLPDQGLRTVHLVNYDYRYQVEQPGLFATDDGVAEARTFFSSPRTVIRKRLDCGDPAKLNQPVLLVNGWATPACQAPLEVTVNGRPAGRFEPGGRGWLELPLDRALLRESNLVDLRAVGELDNHRWWQIGLDLSVPGGHSWFSSDGGATFTAEDLSPDLKEQRGEYLIRLVDRSPDGPLAEPGNLASNPGFERVRTPHSETRLEVVPATDVEVRLPASPAGASCLAMSPDGPSQWLPVAAGTQGATVRVPRVEVYTVLVCARDRAPLERLAAAQAAAAPWALPPVTEPLRQQVAAWEPWGTGFTAAGGARSGERCLQVSSNGDDGQAGAVQVLKFDPPAKALTLRAWSRAANVSGPRDAHYALYVDATCADGSVFNGHHTSFEVGTHDWQEAVLKLTPPQPLASARVHLLFRRHRGQAWFDDVTVRRED